MAGTHAFKRINRRGRVDTAAYPPTLKTLLAMLRRCLRERFRHADDLTVMVLPARSTTPQAAEDPPPSPDHPACADHANSEYCRESWQLHLALLTDEPETHWHRCDHDLLCALVPVAHDGRCLAVVKFVNSGSMAEDDFEREVMLLDVVVRDFVNMNFEFMTRLITAFERSVPPDGPVRPATMTPKHRQPDHPQIVAAMRYIEEHLSDPRLTVGNIARELKIDPNYLSHLYVEQVGQRMSRCITKQRINLAKRLLAKTHLSIKEVSRQCGFANPNWFSYVFRIHAGNAPGAFRKRARQKASPTSGKE
jgi:AraC-like DNA-binding protein